MVKRIAVVIAALCIAAGAHAQTLIGTRGYMTERFVIGASTFGSTSPLQIVGLPTTAQTNCAYVDGSGNFYTAACPVGDITGVSFTLPGLFNVVSACTTGSCAFTFVLADTTANWVFARSTGTGPPSMQAITKAMQFSSTVYTDQTNTWGAFLQTFGGGVTVSSGTTTTQALSSTTGTFSGSVAANAGITVDSTAFTVADATGNVSTTGTLAVTGTADLKGNVSDSTGNLTLNDNVDVLDNLSLGSATGEYVQSANYASRTTGWRADYSGAADFREFFSDQLKVKVFTVEQTQAVNGSMQWTKSVAELAGESTVGGAATCPTLGAAETYWFRDFPAAANIRVFQANDYVSIRTLAWADSGTDGAAELSATDCVGVVTAYADGTAGNDGYQSWTFTRPAGANGGAMAGGTSIPLNQQSLNYGVSADGVLDATVSDGANNINAPYFGVKKWTTSPIAANFTNLARFGQLRGITGTDEYGVFAGPSYNAVNGQFFRASDVSFDLHGIDLSLWDADTANIILRRNSGNPYLAIGNAAPTTYASGEGIWMGSDAGTYKFRIGNPGANLLAYDSGTDVLSVTGTVTAGAGAIGGWTIGASTISATNLSLTSGAANTANITAGTGATAAGINSANASGDIAFWGGSTFANRATAPFRVTAGGALTATSATITGSIQTLASCGSAGAWCGLFDSTGLKWYDSANQIRVQLSSSWQGVAVLASDFSDIFDKEGNYEFIGPSGSVGLFGMTAFETPTTHAIKHVRIQSRNAYATGATTKSGRLDLIAQGTNTSNATDSESTGGGEGAAIFLRSDGPSATQTIALNAGTSISVDGGTLHVDSANNYVGVNDTTPSYEFDADVTGSLARFVTSYGNVQVRGTTTDVMEVHLRPDDNKSAFISWTENGDSDRWALGTMLNDSALYIKQASIGGNDFFKFNIDNSRPTFDALSGAWGTGATRYGAALGLGRNSSGNGAAGAIAFYRRSGTIDFVWSDNAGNLRINSAQPNESLTSPNYDTTTGTVVGTQTSSRVFKHIFGERTDYADMLTTVLAVPLWDFTYKSGAFGGEHFMGITCEDTPEFCMDGGKSLNPANAIGYLVGALKAQQAQIDALTKRLAALESR